MALITLKITTIFTILMRIYRVPGGLWCKSELKSVGIYSLDVFYNKTNYELAYKPVIKDDTVISVIMAGMRENFYEELKSYIKHHKM